MLLLLATAWAHVPHEVVPATAIPRVDIGVPWFLAVDSDGSRNLLRSDDGGETWAPTWGEPMVDVLTEGAWIDGVGPVLLGEGRFWTFDGAAWSAVPLSVTPSSALSAVAGGDALYLATDDGVWAADATGALAHELVGVPIASIHEGWSGPVAVAADGGLWWRTGGVWTAVPAPGGQTAYAATSDRRYLYVGTAEGRVLRWNGSSWRGCATVPYALEAGAHPAITRLAADATTLLVTRAGGGPSVSRDDCVTFTGIAAPMEIDFAEDDGQSFTTDEEAWRAIGIADGRYWVDGYDGFAVTGDGGASWRKPVLIGADYTRGIAFSHAFDADGGVLLGAYGSGVVVTGDGGATFTGEGIGVPVPNVQEVHVAGDTSGYASAFGLFNRQLYRTTDGGRSWSHVTGPYTRMRQLDVGPGRRVWGADIESDPAVRGQLIFSSDSGRAWRSVDTLPIEFDRLPVEHVLDRAPLVCAWSVRHLACSTDDRASFALAYTTAASDVAITALAGWPDDAPARLLLADEEGVWVSDDLTTWTRTLDSGDAEVRRVEVADDGTVFAGDQGGVLWRSDDGGDSWVDTGARVPSQIKVLRARPGFAAAPELLVGTMSGVWKVRGDVVERFMAWQRVDDATDYPRCEGCVAVARSGVGVGQVTVIPAGRRLEVEVRGHTVRVIGGAERSSAVEVWVDGVREWSGVVPRAPLDTVIAEIVGLDDGWHTVEIAVTGFAGLSVDAIEAEGDGATLEGW